MKITKQPELPLLPPATSPTIRELRIATKGINLWSNDYGIRWKVIQAVAMCYGLDISRWSTKTPGLREFANQCYEDALIAYSAFNPDRGT